MSEQSDFGYDAVNWEEVNAENAKLVEAEYRQRFEGTIKGWEDVDKKAQFVLSGLIGLITAVVGLSFTQARSIDTQYLVSLLVLATVLIVAAAFAATSLYPRRYVYSGFTPSDLNVSKWIALLKGDEKSAIRLCGVRTKELARGIYVNDSSNAAKPKWLRNAIIATVAAFPIALLSVEVARWIGGLSNTAGAAIIAPASIAPCAPGAVVGAPVIILFATSALLLGVTVGGLLGWFCAVSHKKLQPW